ncbi:ABC transporter substrate-binding protein [Planotetraspora sp. GP83]|uniref:ABC transporter substrate-binding protein n=1 Tax=Planotetraspora sp. GP83 TaxID=3156264 RepID=UPI00351184D1
MRHTVTRHPVSARHHVSTPNPVTRRAFIGGAGVLALGVAATACGSTTPSKTSPSGRPAGTALVTLVAESSRNFTRNFNPFSPTSRWAALKAMYEPLMINNSATGKLDPWIASKAEWNGPTRLDLTLRNDVKWSDGKPFQASDVVFTFELMKRNKGLIGPASGAWEDYLASVEAVDPATVRFTLAKPYSPALYILVSQFVVPEHVWSSIADPVKHTNPDPVATGPFTVVKSFQPQRYQLTANPHYWQKLGVGGLNIPAFSGNDQISAATIGGQIDWGGLVPDPDKTFVSRDPQHYGYWWPRTTCVYLMLNTEKKPFDDVRVRKAVSLALDRQRMIDIAVWGKSAPANATGLPAGPYKDWIDPAVVQEGASWVGHDAAKAGALLDEAGLKKGADGFRALPDGTPLKLSIIVPTGWNDWISSSQCVADNLKEVGIRVELKTIAYETWTDSTYQGRFDLTLGSAERTATPFEFFRGMMSSATYKPVGTASALNVQRYKNAEADKLLADFAATPDLATQQALSKQLEALFSREAPVVPLYEQPDWGLYNTQRVTGFPTEKDPYAPLTLQSTPSTFLVYPKLRSV